jgi:hypothetical protein
MGEVYVKEGNEFKLVVQDGLNVFVQNYNTGGGDGSSTRSVGFYASQVSTITGVNASPYTGTPFTPTNSPSNFTRGYSLFTSYGALFRVLSKHLGTPLVNFDSANPQQSPFSPTTGAFTAPISGIYKFSAGGTAWFIDQSGDSARAICMYLQKNNAGFAANQQNAVGAVVGTGVHQEKDGQYESISGSWTIQLNQGEQVYLCAEWMGSTPDQQLLYHTYFTGSLVGLVGIPQPLSSPGENGWSELPGGLLMQWGKKQYSASGWSNLQTTIIFPRAFSTIPYNITTSWGINGTYDSNDNFITHYDDPTNTSMKLILNAVEPGSTPSNNISVNWLAIGKA